MASPGAPCWRAQSPQSPSPLTVPSVVALSGFLRRRRRLVAVCVVLLAGGVCLGAAKLRSRRATAMASAAGTASRAVQAARAADAAAWAPDELAMAERQLYEAVTAQRIEETRFWPIPDAERVRAAYAAAEHAARNALELARQRRQTAVDTTAAAMEQATNAVQSGELLAATIPLERDRRALLARASLALGEARVFQREGDLSRAVLRAREASALADLVHDHAAAVAARYADTETLARWRRWKEETIAWSRREGRAAILVVKEAHLLTVFVGGEPTRTYPVDLGFNWIADKARAGDGATPEGRYRIVSRMPASTYYKALLLDYPNAEDRAHFNRARQSGELPRSAGIGGLIEIHGGGGRGRDWTNGCVALTNPDMDDLFRRVTVGTPVTIVGSDNFGAIAEFVVQRRVPGGTSTR